MLIIILLFAIFIYFAYKLSTKYFIKQLNLNNKIEISSYGKSKYFGVYLVLCLIVCFLILLIVYNIILNWYLQHYVLITENISARGLLLFKQQAKQLANDTGFFGDYSVIKFTTLLNKQSLITVAKLYNYYLMQSYFIFGIIAFVVLLSIYVFLTKTINFNLSYSAKLEKIVRLVLFVFTAVAIFTTVAIVVSLLLETIMFFKYVPIHKFLFGTVWNPSQADIDLENSFGSLPLISGTILIAVIAIIFATLIGVLGAVYMSMYMSKKTRKIVKPALEILAGIPSIVYGFFAAIYFAPIIVAILKFFGISASYENALNSGIIIGIMIIPFISSIADDTLQSVPKPIAEGALAMGSLKHEVILKVLLPSAFPGIIGGVILALSRAIGETMVVVMASSLSANLTINPTQPVTTITTQIAMLLQGDQEFDSPKTLSTFALGLMLLTLTLLLNLIIFKITKKYKTKY